jgi:hypothetical protein
MITVIVSAKVAFDAIEKQNRNSVNLLTYYQKKIPEATTEGKTDYLGTIPERASRRCLSIGEPGKVCYTGVNFSLLTFYDPADFCHRRRWLSRFGAV